VSRQTDLISASSAEANRNDS